MPATNRGGRPGDEYLRAQPPSWESVQAGLSIFALVIIVRYCVQRAYSWLGPAERRNPIPIHPTSNLPQPRYQPHPWPMEEKPSRGCIGIEGMTSQDASFGEGMRPARTFPLDPHWMTAGRSIPSHFISKLPPALPLTPPKLSTAIFTLDEQPRSTESFIHQPNPDYMASTSTSPFGADSGASSPIPRRRSYTRVFPMGVHVARQVQAAEGEFPGSTLSPSSYPPTNQLPPAPPSGFKLGEDGKTLRNVNVQGEILSVLDRDGARWTRHTRVYGGNACLACAASGDSHGGFYGATVTPEEMR